VTVPPASRLTFFASVAKGAGDMRDGLAVNELWIYMGWQDIRQRYRRTILGPWWLAISTGLLVLILGFVWSEIFQTEVRTFLPFFAIGYVLWIFLSGAVNEACTGFTQFEGIIKQRRIPFSTLLYRIGMRHAIALAHNAVIVALLLFWAGPTWSYSCLLAIPGLMLFAITVFLMLIPVAILCTRFRDFPQIVGNAVQIMFFVTPIMWRPDVLRNYRWIAEYNPVAHLLDIVRLPLLGTAPGLESWIWSVSLLVVSFLAAARLLGRYGHRVAYWL
jgi:ABC-type polysaccharide/polyol phosphate export permease